jgi:hypothetical protein
MGETSASNFSFPRKSGQRNVLYDVMNMNVASCWDITTCHRAVYVWTVCWFLARLVLKPGDGSEFFSETSVHTRTTRCYILEDGNPHNYRFKNLRSNPPKKLHSFKSEKEPYRPSVHLCPAKLMSNSSDRGVAYGQRNGTSQPLISVF